MRKGKLILSAISFLITIGTALSFKVAKKAFARNVFVQLNNQCVTCADLWTIAGLERNTHCHTYFLGALVTGAGFWHFTFYTERNTPATCANPTTRTTNFQP